VKLSWRVECATRNQDSPKDHGWDELFDHTMVWTRSHDRLKKLNVGKSSGDES
jgi:hypothetical protein